MRTSSAFGIGAVEPDEPISISGTQELLPCFKWHLRVRPLFRVGLRVHVDQPRLPAGSSL